MTRAAVLLPALLLSGCVHLPWSPGAITPDSLSGAALVAEGWCSQAGTGSTVWYCRVYQAWGGRVLVAYHSLGGELMAIGEQVGDGQVLIRWTAPAEEEEAKPDGIVL